MIHWGIFLQESLFRLCTGVVEFLKILAEPRFELTSNKNTKWHELNMAYTKKIEQQ